MKFFQIFSLTGILLLLSCRPTTIMPVPPKPSASPTAYTVLTKTNQIMSGLQVFSVNSSNKGVVLWNEGTTLYSSTLKGRLLQNGVVSQFISIEGIEQTSNLTAQFSINQSGDGLIAWNGQQGGLSVGSGPSSTSLFSVAIQDSNILAPARRLGSYRLQDSQLDEQGNGFLLVSTENTGRITELSSKAPIQVYVLPIQQGKINPFEESQLQSLISLPISLSPATTAYPPPFVWAAKTDLQGNGFVIWGDPQQNKVFAVQVTKFSAAATNQELTGVSFYSGCGNLKLENSNGYVTCAAKEGTKLFLIRNHIVQVNPRLLTKLTPPRQTVCRFGDYPISTAWDSTLDIAGNGFLSWLDADRKQVIVQKISNFELQPAQQKIKGPDNLDICMTRLQVDAQGDALLAALSTECPNQSCQFEQANLQKIVWTAKIKQSDFSQ